MIIQLNFKATSLMAAITDWYQNGKFDPFNIKLDGWSVCKLSNLK